MRTDLISSSDLREINLVTRAVSSATSDLRLEKYSTPLNLADERNRLLERWHAGSSYEPSFQYHLPEDGVEERLNETLRISEANHPLASALLDDLAATSAMVTALRTGDDDRITELSLAEFGAPPSDLIKAAHDVLNSVPLSDVEAPSVSAADAADRLMAVLASAGLDHWTVIVDSTMSARMSVRVISSTIRVQAGATFIPSELKRLAVHEIGTHVLRAVNGRRQPLEVLAVGIPGFLSTEEGLAAWHEQQWACSDPLVLRRYALRVIAASEALRLGFGATFQTIVQHTNPVDAFSIVQRAKRGFRDPSRPGAHLKDQVYLQGLREVQSHLADNPQDHPLLLAGRFGIQHLPYVRGLAESGRLAPLVLTPESIIR